MKLLFLASSEARSSPSRCCQGWLLVRPPPSLFSCFYLCLLVHFAEIVNIFCVFSEKWSTLSSSRTPLYMTY